MGYVINPEAFGSILFKYLMFLVFSRFFSRSIVVVTGGKCRSCSVLIVCMVGFIIRGMGEYDFFINSSKFSVWRRIHLWHEKPLESDELLYFLIYFPPFYSSCVKKKDQLHYSFILTLPVQTPFLVWFILLVSIRDIASYVKTWEFIYGLGYFQMLVEDVVYPSEPPLYACGSLLYFFFTKILLGF